MNIVVEGDEQQTINNINALVRRTDKENPKPADMEALRATFEAVPWVARSLGNLRRAVFNTVVSKAVGNSAAVREAVTHYVKKMKEDMNYAGSSFVEKMLIDEIIMRWVRLQAVEQAHLNATTGEHSMKEGIYHEKRLHLTQKRYLDAIETLAKVRKMVVQTQAKGVEMFKNLVETENAKNC